MYKDSIDLSKWKCYECFKKIHWTIHSHFFIRMDIVEIGKV